MRQNRQFFILEALLNVFEYKVFLSIVLTILICNQSHAQLQEDNQKQLNNTFRMNISNTLIFGKNCLIFGYERTFNNNQSISVNLGQFSIPKINLHNFGIFRKVSSETRENGFSASLDYRFYLKTENKYRAPRGVYFGPYFSYNKFNRTYDVSINTSIYEGDLKAKLNLEIPTFGMQLGYQFVFKNRISLDLLLIGPGISYYKFALGLSTDIDPAIEGELLTLIDDAISKRLPGFDMVINSGEFKETGILKTFGMGFRYVVMLGYRFNFSKYERYNF